MRGTGRSGSWSGTRSGSTGTWGAAITTTPAPARPTRRRAARASSAPLVGNHAELDIPMAEHMPTDPANATNVFVTQYEFWSDYRDDMDAKFQAWLAQ